MRKQKQLYLEGKRQRAIGYDFSPLMGDPFEGFGDEGVLVGKTLGIFNPEKIPAADQTNETVLTKAAIRNTPFRRMIRHQFSHPMLDLQKHSPMGLDPVNHVMEQNGPVALEIKDLTTKMRLAHYDAETLTQMAKEIVAGKTPFGVSFRDNEYYDILGTAIPGLKAKVDLERLSANRSVDYAFLKEKIGSATSFDVYTIPLINVVPGRASYMQGIANEITSANQTAANQAEAKDYYERLRLATTTSYADLSAAMTANLGLLAQLNPTRFNSLVNNVYNYQQTLRNAELRKLAQSYLDQGYKTTGELPLIGTIFGTRTPEQMNPGLNAVFTSMANAKIAKELDDKAKEAVNKDIWSAAEYYSSLGGMASLMGTLTSPQAVEARAKLQERIDWYDANSKQGVIRRHRNRVQWLILNTEEGRAIAAEDARIAKEREAEGGGFFSTLLKIIGPLAAIALPFVGPALLTSLPVIGGATTAITTAVSALPIVSKVVDVATTVKSAIPTEVIDNAKTLYNAGTSVINTVYPAKPPTTTSVLPVAPAKPIETAAPAPAATAVAVSVKKPVRYYEHPMLTYGLIKRKA